MDSGMFSNFLQGKEGELGLKPRAAESKTTMLCGL